MELLEDRKGKSKGAAVVEFREKESVQRCVDALHRYPMNDRLLTAKEIRVNISLLIRGSSHNFWSSSQIFFI